MAYSDASRRVAKWDVIRCFLLHEVHRIPGSQGDTPVRPAMRRFGCYGGTIKDLQADKSAWHRILTSLAPAMLVHAVMRSKCGMVLPVMAALLAFCVVSPSATAQTNVARPATMARSVEVRVKHTRPMRGMTATQKVTITGGVAMDSYDSGLGPWSLATSSGNGFIGTTAKTAGYLEIKGSVKLAGQIGTGAPGVLQINGGSAAVGSKAFIDSGGSGIEAGSLQDDLNVSYPDVVPPFSLSVITSPPGTGLVLGTNYNYIFSGGTYAMDDFKMANGTKAIVSGHTVLYIRNAFEMVSGATLLIQPGVTLDIYVGGTTSITGGSIVNVGAKPENLNYFGLPTHTTFYLSGGSSFYGTIYAPSTRIEFAGTSAFYGASVCREIMLSGNFAYHYDEALARKGLQYVPVSWREQ